ncbi:SDR family NAD(P)-dependent oxidoreductase [Acetobacter lambici]|uniref:SDR family NAD(P)-dependent oxidoreductase n=1 Tax=Acetobacter lambici TaxID=1332824 RepID=UPI0014085FCC
MFEKNKKTGQKTAVVSGASGGIGRALCYQLRQRGYWVIGLSRQVNPAVDTAYVDCMLTCDLTDSKTIEDAARTIGNTCDSINLFVFCAGVISPQSVATLEHGLATEQVQINLVGVMLLTNAILPMMAKGSHIIYTNSMAGIFPLAGSSVYSASKFGLRGFALALEQELKPQQIHVSSIFPGSVNTSMLATEMEHGGSVLNFMSAPQEPEAIANWILSNGVGKHVENFPSSFDRLFCSLFLWSPRFLRLCLPFMTAWAKASRTRYRKSLLKNRSGQSG